MLARDSDLVSHTKRERDDLHGVFNSNVQPSFLPFSLALIWASARFRVMAGRDL